MEFQAHVDGIVGVDRAGVEFDVLNFSFLVDHERCTARPLVLIAIHGVLLENSIRGEDFAVHIAEEREGNANLFGKSGVGGRAVDANAENLRVVRLELGQISLIGL